MPSKNNNVQQISYLATDYLFPEWNIWTQFLDSTTAGLNVDSLSESHPIEVSVLISSFNETCS